MMRPSEELSRELRQDHSADLDHRRVIAALNLVAAGSMAMISLYQLGIIKRLPQPRLPFLDANKVAASAEAYSFFQTPDAFLGLASFAATAILAAMGGKDRAREQPWIPVALAAKLGFDVVQAGTLTVLQWTKYRAFCIWCLTAAAASFASAPFVVPELTKALRALNADRHRPRRGRLDEVLEV